METLRNIRPFTFDTRVFDDQLVVDKPQPKFTESDIAAAKAEAFAQGKAEGMREEREGQMRKACDLLARLLAENARLECDAQKQAESLVADAGILARKMLTKLMPVATAKSGMAEIGDIIRNALLEQHATPRLSIHIAPPMQPAVAELLEKLRAETDFEGKLALMTDEGLGESDCRVEWASGGTERLVDTIWTDIDACIQKAIPQGEPT